MLVVMVLLFFSQGATKYSLKRLIWTKSYFYNLKKKFKYSDTNEVSTSPLPLLLLARGCYAFDDNSDMRPIIIIGYVNLLRSTREYYIQGVRLNVSQSYDSTV